MLLEPTWRVDSEALNATIKYQAKIATIEKQIAKGGALQSKTKNSVSKVRFSEEKQDQTPVLSKHVFQHWQEKSKQPRVNIKKRKALKIRMKYQRHSFASRMELPP